LFFQSQAIITKYLIFAVFFNSYRVEIYLP